MYDSPLARVARRRGSLIGGGECAACYIGEQPAVGVDYLRAVDALVSGERRDQVIETGCISGDGGFRHPLREGYRPRNLELALLSTNDGVGCHAPRFGKLIVEALLEGSGYELRNQVRADHRQDDAQDRIGHDDLGPDVPARSGEGRGQRSGFP